MTWIDLSYISWSRYNIHLDHETGKTMLLALPVKLGVHPLMSGLIWTNTEISWSTRNPVQSGCVLILSIWECKIHQLLLKTWACETTTFENLSFWFKVCVKSFSWSYIVMNFQDIHKLTYMYLGEYIPVFSIVLLVSDNREEFRVELWS